MRRFVALLAVALSACSSGGGHTAATSTTHAPEPAVTKFAYEIAAAGSVGFHASYHVTRKLGPVESDVDVVSTPPRWEIRSGAIVVRGPDVSTADDARLSSTGVFANFFAAGPQNALLAAAERPSAGSAVFSTRAVAGVPLRCAGIPQAGVVDITVCVTPQGVVGFYDTAAVHYELTSFTAGS